jgi:ankyrin repeat protein
MFPDFTPLMRYVAIGYHEGVKYLLENGANTNDTSRWGATPLFLAIHHNDTIDVDLLLQYKADPNYFRDKSYPADDAASHNEAEVLRLLAKYGANLTRSGFLGRTPLHAAANAGAFDAVTTLLQLGINVNIVDTEGDIPLESAIFGGHPDCVNLLIRNGANVNYIDSAKFSPVLCALTFIRNNSNKLLQRFMDSTEWHDVSGERRKTIYREILTMLLKAGASPKWRLKYNAPLHLAAEACDSTVAALLIKYGADKTAKDHNGKTPYEVAVMNDCKQLEEILRP